MANAEGEPKTAGKRIDCCESMELALNYASASERRVAGLQVVHVFDVKTGGLVWSPVGYVIPDRGRGKEKVRGSTTLVRLCPFCGAKQPGRPG